jgi:acetoin utilization protein AcuB
MDLARERINVHETDVMTEMSPPKPIITIALDVPLSHAIELMQQHGVRHLPVLDGGQLVGIVSERDLTAIETLEPTELTSLSVAEAMTPEPYTVLTTASLAEVAEKMAEQKYGCVVIVDARGAVLDIFTTNDALRLLGKALPELSVEEALRRASS